MLHYRAKPAMCHVDHVEGGEVQITRNPMNPYHGGGNSMVKVTYKNHSMLE